MGQLRSPRRRTRRPSADRTEICLRSLQGGRTTAASVDPLVPRACATRSRRSESVLQPAATRASQRCRLQRMRCWKAVTNFVSCGMCSSPFPTHDVGAGVAASAAPGFRHHPGKCTHGRASYEFSKRDMLGGLHTCNAIAPGR